VVLAHLLLGHNIFKGPSPEESRKLVMNMPIPDFRTLDARIDERLNQMLHKALSRDLNNRYPSADEMLFDLEHYIYHSGYGPTNETLGKMIREVFGHNVSLAREDAKGSTQLIERTARSTVFTKPQ
jgi:eukaryotic-like serine/threonine-protein kinase